MRDEGRIQTPDLPVVHQCAGKLTGVTETAQRVSLRIEHPKYAPAEITGTLLLLDTDDAEHLFGTFVREFTVEAHTPYPHTVRVWGVHRMSSAGPEITLSASGYDLGCERATVPEGEDVTVTVELTGGTVLRRWQTMLFSYDGTISHHAGDRENIVWHDEGRRVTALSRTVYEKVTTGSNSATLQIDRPALRYKFKSDGNASILDFVDQVCSDLRDVLLLLMLCSRERVEWFELSVQFPTRPAAYPSRRRRSAAQGRVPSPTHLLIAQRELARDAGFEHLLQAFRSSPHKDVLRRVIEFEVGSYQGPALETNFVLCHAALEALIAEVSRTDPLLPKYSRSEWKAMSTQVREAVRACGTSRRLAHDLIGYSLTKVVELQRAPLPDIVIRETQRLLDRDMWFWIWPESLGFEEGVRLTIHLRNELVHKAGSSNLQSLYDNLAPLQILVERLVLKLLKWPDGKICSSHDQDLRGINRDVEARASRERLAKLQNSPPEH